MSYLANAAHLDGIRAEEIAEALDADVDEELGHARTFADRIKELYGTPPGSMEFTAEQAYLQPPEDATDVVDRHQRRDRGRGRRDRALHDGSSRPATASTGPRRTWSSTSCATRRATCAPSSATCASSSDVTPSREAPAARAGDSATLRRPHSPVEARYLLAMLDLSAPARRRRPRSRAPSGCRAAHGARDDPAAARAGFRAPEAHRPHARGPSAALVLSSRRAAAHTLVHDLLGVDDEQSRAEADAPRGRRLPRAGRRLLAGRGRPPGRRG